MTVQIDTTAEIDAVRLKTEGSHPSAPSSGHVLLYFVTGTTLPGLYTKLSNGQQIGPFITGSPNSSAGFTQVVNENGSSFANWTSGGGTWSSDGTVIKQTDTGSAGRTAYLTTMVDTAAGAVFEADIKVVSAGAAGDFNIGGLVIGYDGTPTGAGAAGELRLAGGSTKTVLLSRMLTNNLLSTSFSWNLDTFYKFRIVSTGGLVSAYVDGVLIGIAGSFPANDMTAKYIGLFCYGAQVQYKNIKAWVQTLP